MVNADFQSSLVLFDKTIKTDYGTTHGRRRQNSTVSANVCGVRGGESVREVGRIAFAPSAGRLDAI